MTIDTETTHSPLHRLQERSGKTLWKKHNDRPLFLAAPMEDVTDTIFRRLVRSLGAPDIFFTEFISARGLWQGSKLAWQRVECHPLEDKTHLVAQLWGREPEDFFKAARLLAQQGFAGIDLNMGCPKSKIISKGVCAALIEEPHRVREIIQASKEACGSLELSLKTRLGFRQKDPSWLSFLLTQTELSAITFHARLAIDPIASDPNEGPLDWDMIAFFVQQARLLPQRPLVIGNGDIRSIAEGYHLAQRLLLDGVMFGRALLRDPYLFSTSHSLCLLARDEKLHLLKRHLEEHIVFWENKRPYAPLKKFVKVYLQGFHDSPSLLAEMMQTTEVSEALSLLRTWLAS